MINFQSGTTLSWSTFFPFAVLIMACLNKEAVNLQIVFQYEECHGWSICGQLDFHSSIISRAVCAWQQQNLSILLAYMHINAVLIVNGIMIRHIAGVKPEALYASRLYCWLAVTDNGIFDVSNYMEKSSSTQLIQSTMVAVCSVVPLLGVSLLPLP